MELIDKKNKGKISRDTVPLTPAIYGKISSILFRRRGGRNSPQTHEENYPAAAPHHHPGTEPAAAPRHWLLTEAGAPSVNAAKF